MEAGDCSDRLSWLLSIHRPIHRDIQYTHTLRLTLFFSNRRHARAGHDIHRRVHRRRVENRGAVRALYVLGLSQIQLTACRLSARNYGSLHTSHTHCFTEAGDCSDRLPLPVVHTSSNTSRRTWHLVPLQTDPFLQHSQARTPCPS